MYTFFTPFPYFLLHSEREMADYRFICFTVRAHEQLNLIEL